MCACVCCKRVLSGHWLAVRKPEVRSTSAQGYKQTFDNSFNNSIESLCELVDACGTLMRSLLTKWCEP